LARLVDLGDVSPLSDAALCRELLRVTRGRRSGARAVQAQMAAVRALQALDSRNAPAVGEAARRRAHV
jgi:hypothetical protein